MAQQLRLDLPRVAALGREDFLVAPPNTLAVAMIDAWPEWQNGKLVLTGPEGSGKTHLVHVWAARSGASIVSARDITEESVPDLAQGCVAVEDVPEIAGMPEIETALFHLHNLALQGQQTLVFTGDRPLPKWGLTLPDLQSRLQGASSATLDPPDDALLAAVLVKLFADRQISPAATLVPYLVARIDRSFAAAAQIVDRLDRVSLARGVPVGRKLAAELLAAEG